MNPITSMPDKELDVHIKAIIDRERKIADTEPLMADIYQCLDLTTLEGSDNEKRISALCEMADNGISVSGEILNVAAVCVYPTMVNLVKKHLKNKGIKVASVAGGFPAAQTALFIKTAEVKYALDEGADEIDMVISQGMFLEGRYKEVGNEISAIKALCRQKHLKVILETCVLDTSENIYNASNIAMEAGADFIKTSTGKATEGASLKSVFVMLHAIKDHHNKTGKRIGIKPAGGISDPDTALDYYLLVRNILGTDWLNNEYFRIGASRLAKRIADHYNG